MTAAHDQGMTEEEHYHELIDGMVETVVFFIMRMLWRDEDEEVRIAVTRYIDPHVRNGYFNRAQIVHAAVMQTGTRRYILLVSDDMQPHIIPLRDAAPNVATRTA